MSDGAWNEDGVFWGKVVSEASKYRDRPPPQEERRGGTARYDRVGRWLGTCERRDKKVGQVIVRLGRRACRVQ